MFIIHSLQKTFEPKHIMLMNQLLFLLCIPSVKYGYEVENYIVMYMFSNIDLWIAFP